ncbi:MAG: hypothetical protein ABIC40_06240, partial [bacterium]
MLILRHSNHMKRIAVIFLTAILLCATGCHIKNTRGNLMGVVVRENSGEIVENPLVLICDPVDEEINPLATVRGDSLGR